MYPVCTLHVVWTEGKAVYFSSRKADCRKRANGLPTLAEVRSFIVPRNARLLGEWINRYLIGGEEILHDRLA